MDQVQPSTSCLSRIPGAHRALHALLGSRTQRATKMLAQCLFHAKWLALPKSDGPWVRIEYAGSGALCGRICYSHAYDSIGSLLNRLAPRLLGSLGETFVTYGLCKKPMPDQPEYILYKLIPRYICLSSIVKVDETGKSPPLCLQLIIKQHQTDEDKVNFINEALRQATTDEQLLRILEIIGQIENPDTQYHTLRDNIHYFLNIPYLKITGLITNVFWKVQVLKAIIKKLIKRNNLEKALKITLLTLDFGSNDEALKAIALKLAQRNDLEKALEAAGKITNIWRKDKVLKAIALKLVERKDFKGARNIALQINDDSLKNQILQIPDVRNTYMMRVISKIAKVAYFTILSLITYKLIAYRKNSL